MDPAEKSLEDYDVEWQDIFDQLWSTAQTFQEFAIATKSSARQEIAISRTAISSQEIALATKSSARRVHFSSTLDVDFTPRNPPSTSTNTLPKDKIRERNAEAEPAIINEQAASLSAVLPAGSQLFSTAGGCGSFNGTELPRAAQSHGVAESGGSAAKWWLFRRSRSGP
jgi:hypothetical protein